MKKVFIFGLLLSICLISPAFSQSSETLTFTTYYPSPIGVYRLLEVAESLAVGDISTTSINTVDGLDPGELWVQGSVIYNPRDDDPASWASGKEGEVHYSSMYDRFYYFNGDTGNWMGQGAGGGSSCFTKYNNDTATCPSCPVGWTQESCLGTYGYGGYRLHPYPLVMFPPGGGQATSCSNCNRWELANQGAFYIGQAALCCK
jgi:hypothetical protein